MLRFMLNIWKLSTYSIAIFLVAARINHSASPNASMMWADGVGRMMFFTLCDIEPGEEITIAYCCARQAEVSTTLFQCNCPRCVLVPANQRGGQVSSSLFAFSKFLQCLKIGGTLCWGASEDRAMGWDPTEYRAICFFSIDCL
jgi:hypothetical protein